MLGQPRATQQRVHWVTNDEPRLAQEMIELAEQYGRYGFRRITEMLRRKGWRVNHKRIERLWRREGLKVPKRQPKRCRLWLKDGSSVRLRPGHRDEVWSYDFVHHLTHDGRAFLMLTPIDVARQLTSEEVLERLSDPFVRRGVPDFIRNDNGSEFAAMKFRDWLERVEVNTLYIEPGSPDKSRIRLNHSTENYQKNYLIKDRRLTAGAKCVDRTVTSRAQHATSAQLARLPLTSNGGNSSRGRTLENYHSKTVFNHRDRSLRNMSQNSRDV